MNRRIIDLWADIGSEEYWRDLPVWKGGTSVPFESVYVPFNDRWPQPGFIGKGYFDSDVRVLVVGQNPRASNTSESAQGDQEMFNLIRCHSSERSAKSLRSLFTMTRKFMLGDGYGRPWGWVEDIVKNNFYLKVDEIAYLNTIPVATVGNNFNLKTLSSAYEKSTKPQLRLLKPHKILFHGKGPYNKFHEWESNNAQRDTCFLERKYRNAINDPERFAEVRKWLRYK